MYLYVHVWIVKRFACVGPTLCLFVIIVVWICFDAFYILSGIFTFPLFSLFQMPFIYIVYGRCCECIDFIVPIESRIYKYGLRALRIGKYRVYRSRSEDLGVPIFIVRRLNSSLVYCSPWKCVFRCWANIGVYRWQGQNKLNVY